MSNKPLQRFSSHSFHLFEEEVERLNNIVKRSENWRERERAQTLLILNETKSSRQTAERVGIHEKTVGSTRRDWVSRGYESLVDRPRCGAPSKMNESQLADVMEFAQQTPSTAKALLAHHVESGGQSVHINTMVNALKAAGFAWKRTRHSLKKDATRSDSNKPNRKLPK